MTELSRAVTGRTASLAFHLPQFHPVPENDEWWGPGFTEWRNVVRAAPRFPWHQQPHLPGELGFYDLRVPETRRAQAALARAHGVDGFIYYHYWFNGRRILEQPVQALLREGEPDFPFAVCWANENWSRLWNGGDSQLLLEQRYSPEDDEAFLTDLLPLFADPRYIRIDDRPVLFLYRAALLPDLAATADRWRRVAAGVGLELHLVALESHGARYSREESGFDATGDFHPHRASLGPRVGAGWRDRVRGRLGGVNPYARDRVHEYDQLVRNALARPDEAQRYRCVVPTWDNSARRTEGAFVVRGSTPQKYGQWVAEALRDEQDLLLVNAWNEWAEGAHLEPDLHHGRAYLEAHAAAVRRDVTTG